MKDKRLRIKIQKDINYEELEDVKVSYSILNKKNKSGLGSNDRVFFLIHKKCVGYINEIPKNVLLPFETKEKLPKLKA